MSSRAWLRADAVVLPPALAEVMLAHADSRPDEEVCGLLGADAQGLRSIYPVPNAAARPSHAYLVGPEAQFRVFRTLRESGQRLGGVYHSHPFGPAVPSTTDFAEAGYPAAAWFIVSRSDRPRLRAWLLGRPGFTELRIEPA